MWRKILLGLIGGLLAAEALGHLLLGNMGQVELYQRQPADGRCFGLKPDAQVDYTGWWSRIPPVTLEVNSAGYRGPVLPESKGPEEFRVAMIGDSFVYGQVVEAGQTIAAHLEKELGVPVMNFGIPGLSLEDQQEQYRLFVRRWHPDLVLLLLTGNDLEESLCDSGKRFPPGWMLAEIRLFRVAYMASRRILPSSDPPDAAVRARSYLQALQKEVQADGGRLAGVALQLPEARNQPGARDAAQRGANRPVAPPPGAPRPAAEPGRPPPPPPDPALAPPATESPIFQALAVDGVPWMDATLWTEGTPKDRLENVPGEGHFTGAGNHQASAGIARWLQQQGLIRSTRDGKMADSPPSSLPDGP